MKQDTKQAQPFAVFDIDGTLVRWQLYHAVADELAKLNIINSKKYQTVLKARENWKRRLSINSFTEYEQSLIQLISQAVPGIDYSIFQQICTDVVRRYQDQVYTFTRDLIGSLKTQNYLIFAISASPSELVSLVAAYYGFDSYRASTYEVSNNKLTDKETILYGDTKTEHLKQLIASSGATMSGSIAVGDTLGDLGMLRLVERAIAFNPSKELYVQAIAKNWEIVIERKNVVYRLINNNGKYILAPTGQ
jgi:HAD superfamily hydrolase (TIGR01490 family)